jgi:hypothetical protein
MLSLGNRIEALDPKLDALSARVDGKIEVLASRVESRIDHLIRTQIHVHERLARLESRNGGDGSIPPIEFEP